MPERIDDLEEQARRRVSDDAGTRLSNGMNAAAVKNIETIAYNNWQYADDWGIERRMTPELADETVRTICDPRSVFDCITLASALNTVDRTDEALPLARRAVEMERNATTLMNLATILNTLGKFTEAFPLVSEAYAINPAHPFVSLMYSEALLRRGDWKFGWEIHEKHFWDHEWKEFREKYPVWQGHGVAGRRIAVAALEGFGDAILYFRWVYLFKKLGAKVIFYCHHSIAPLFAKHPWLDEVVSVGDEEVYFDFSKFDYFIPLIALPNRFNVNPEPFPWSGAYLGTKRKAELPRNGKPLVGLCTKAGEICDTIRTRTLSAEQKARLLYLDSVEWVSLDYGDQPLISDWGDTAALINALDMVVSVDTGVFHLAAAMGKPTWAMLPGGLTAWSFGIDRSDSLFYRSAQLFRSDGPGIDGAVDAVVAELIK